MNIKLQRFRRLAFIRQGCRCYCCNLPIWESDQDKFVALYKIGRRKSEFLKSTAEHLVAQQDGGTDLEENIAAACYWCNHMRHHSRSTSAPNCVKYKEWVIEKVSRRCWHPAIGMLLTNASNMMWHSTEQ
jgi:hypothetical protein